MTKVGLALGSGGLRGMAHLGVLKVLEEENIPVDCIAGCSIGSLIGALYACGHEVDRLIRLAGQLKRRHVLDFSLPKEGLFSGTKILELMDLLTKRCTFADLQIPLRVVATDLNKGERIVFQEGSVSQAVRASTAVPGVFAPWRRGDAVLVDGAVMDPTPIDTAFAMGADLVVAVDLSQTHTEFPLETMFDIIVKSIDIMEFEMIKRRAERPGTLLVRPQLAHVAPSSFEHVEESVALGMESMRAALPQLRAMLA